MTDTETDTDTGFLTATRTFYDAIAEDYAAHFHDPLGTRPLDRAMLAGFAELVGSGGRVADLGCGPGRVTAHLDALGLSVLGIDLSAGMVEFARRENPGLTFRQGSMLELDLPDGGLAGAVAWYSIIHTPVDRLPALFAEFARVLAPGGHLLLAFQVGDEPLFLEEPFGHPVSLYFHRRRPDHISTLLEEAGFSIRAGLDRAPDLPAGESTHQAFLLAHRATT